MRLTLRYYQDDSTSAMLSALSNGRNPLCVLPTGAGKSLVLASVIKALYPSPCLVLSHVKELLEQDANALSRLAPEIPHAFFSAGLKEKNAQAPVVFGSVQSVYRSLDLFKSYRKAVFVDEAHLCPRKADAMYGAVFSHFAAAQRGGFTATASRMDSGSLIDGADAWFDCIAHDVPPKELIDKGYLLPLTGVLTSQQANLAGVQKRGGEYAFEQAQQAVIKTLSIPEAIASAKQHAKDRKSWLVFAAGIEHANEVTAELRRQNISAACVTNETSAQERSETIDKFKAGEFRALVNVGVLTTGFDAPMTDCILCMRPTQSVVLWQQMLGRGMRLAEGKRDCLLLDYVGNLDRMGGVGVVLKIRDERALDPLAGKKKSRRETNRQEERGDPQLFEASQVDPMMTGQLFEAVVNKLTYFTVSSKRYPGKKILIANYSLQDEFGRALNARAFICIEYEGGARHHAVRWFTRRGVPKDRAPRSADAGMLIARAMRPPVDVMVRYDRHLNCFLVEHETFAETVDVAA